MCTQLLASMFVALFKGAKGKTHLIVCSHRPTTEKGSHYVFLQYFVSLIIMGSNNLSNLEKVKMYTFLIVSVV